MSKPAIACHLITSHKEKELAVWGYKKDKLKKLLTREDLQKILMIPDIDAELNVNGRSGGKFEDENFVKYDKDTEKVLMELEVKRLINKVGH